MSLFTFIMTDDAMIVNGKVWYKFDKARGQHGAIHLHHDGWC